VENGLRSLGETASTPNVVIGPNVESLHVGVDKRRFERVMAHLLENAANYGGGATVISVTTAGPKAPNGDTPGGAPRVGAGARVRNGGARHGGVARHGGGGRNGSVNGASKAGGAPFADDMHAMIEIGVEDAGPGISAVERAKVFDRFYRGSAAGRRGTGTGTGLGLALVAEHVRLMNGEAWVESSPSGGARFVISLPVLEGDEGPVW
jgi:signal transduction histidine kinase